MADLRTQTVSGLQCDDRVKSVCEGKEVPRVLMRDLGTHPPDGAFTPPGDPRRTFCCPSGFVPFGGSDARTRGVSLVYNLGCQRVVFHLRSTLRHGAVQTLRHAETGEMVITKVRLPRQVSLQAICHKVGHVLGSVLQMAQPLSDSLSPAFVAQTAALRKGADYTCVDQATGSPQFLRHLRRSAPSPARDGSTRQLEPYDETCV